MGFLFSKRKNKSASSAKNRLQFVLYSEHQGLPPETLEKIKSEFITVITKYVDVDTENLDVKITPDGAIQANIPILEKKGRRV